MFLKEDIQCLKTKTFNDKMHFNLGHVLKIRHQMSYPKSYVLKNKTFNVLKI